MEYPVLIYTDREKEILNPAVYSLLKARGLYDTTICLKCDIRDEAMRKFKDDLNQNKHFRKRLATLNG